jgi:N4-gp56 family major capsid protein
MVLSELTKVMALNMRETEDQLSRDVLASTAFVINCTNGSNSDNPTEVTLTDVQIVIRRMLANDARTLSNIIQGTDRFGTGPIRNSFFTLIHSDMATEFEQIPQFFYAANYANQSNLLESEWGSVANLRCLQSSKGSKEDNASALGRTVYNNIVVGAEGYMHVKQNRYSASFIYHPPQLSGPLELYSSIGWKMAQASRISQEDWVCNLRSTLAN